jgi:hypothetical protein
MSELYQAFPLETLFPKGTYVLLQHTCGVDDHSFRELVEVTQSHRRPNVLLNPSRQYPVSRLFCLACRPLRGFPTDLASPPIAKEEISLVRRTGGWIAFRLICLFRCQRPLQGSSGLIASTKMISHEQPERMLRRMTRLRSTE